MAQKVIVSAAITGGMTVPSQSPYIPVTPEEIATSAIEASRAGAAIVHIHVRDREGRPTADQTLFEEVYDRISADCDAIVQTTTGGGVGMTIEERAQVVARLKPEMATLNCGSIIFPVAERIADWQHTWEREYLESTTDYVFRNTFSDMEHMSRIMAEQNTKPELEVYDVGHLYNIAFLLDAGQLQPPLHIQFVLGVLGGIAARPEELFHLRERARTLFHDHTWSVAGIGYSGEFELATLSLLLGGHARVGLEDNLRLRPGHLATSNAALVEKIVRIARELDREPATPEEARQILKLPSRSATPSPDGQPPDATLHSVEQRAVHTSGEGGSPSS